MAASAQQDAAETTAARTATGGLPAIEEPAIEPVPEKIDKHPPVSAAALVERQLHACADHDVLPAVQRHLHLRDEVPLHVVARRHFTLADELHHGRPAPAVLSLQERAPERRPKKRGVVGDLMIQRALEAAVEMEKTVGGQNLADGYERLDDGDAAAQAFALLARGKLHFAADAGDRAGVQASEHDPLECERDIAEPAAPGAGPALLHVERDRHLVLTARSDPPLVDEGAVRGLAAAPIENGRHHRFVLRERLFGDERARQV